LPFCHVTWREREPPGAGYPEHPRTLGDELKKSRVDLGLSQKTLAERLGVDESTVWNWEHGRTEPPASLRVRIIRFLG
jgi:transcriptional regulator with XRE-family HTH domain